jgi:hypothetical protein
MDSLWGVISFDVSLGIILALDFLAVTRRRDRIFSFWPPLLVAVSAVAHAYLVDGWRALGPLEFAGVLAAVALGALFGYYNFVAFSKRGVTFAILANHARPARERQDDAAFIDLKLRLVETRGHGWVREGPGGFRLTRKGRAVLRLYRLALAVLRVEAVG